MSRPYLFVIIGLLIIAVIGFARPTESTLSEQTISKLDGMVTLIEKVNKNIDTLVIEQRNVNKLLLEKYKEREAITDKAYEDLLNQYGITEPEPEAGELTNALPYPNQRLHLPNRIMPVTPTE